LYIVRAGSEQSSGDAGPPLVPDWLSIGARACVDGHAIVIIKYIGTVDFDDGLWIGVQCARGCGSFSALTLANDIMGVCMPHISPLCIVGDNDGSVNGIRYFNGDKQSARFVRADALRKL
jgi:hypothetical protein